MNKSGSGNLNLPNASSKGVPNFAFPKDVKKEAEKELKEALSKSNYKDAFRALLDYSVSEIMISGEGYNTVYYKCDSLKTIMPGEYRLFLNTLQAQILMALYDNDRWEFNRRKLPLDNYPGNIKEWSAELVNKRINELAQETLEGFTGINPAPITDFKTIIEVGKGEESLTDTDFITLQFVDMLRQFNRSGARTIPFVTSRAIDMTPAEKSWELINKFIDYTLDDLDKGEITQRYQIIVYLVSKNNPDNALINSEIIERLYPTPYCALLLANYIEREADKITSELSESIMREDDEDALNGEKNSDNATQIQKEAVSRLEKLITSGREYLAKYPTAQYKSELSRVLDNISRPQCSIKMSNRFIPGEKMDVVIDYVNIPALYLHICKSTYKSSDMIRMFGNPDMRKIINTATKVRTVKIDINKSSRIRDIISQELEGLEAGQYYIAPSLRADRIELPGMADYEENAWRGFIVSDISLNYVSAGYGTNGRLYVVDSHNQQPVAGARVQWTRGWNNNDRAEGITGEEGFIELKDIKGNGNYIRAYANKGASYAMVNGYLDYQLFRTVRETSIDLYTDLSIYRPGDTVTFAGVIAGAVGKMQTPITNVPLQIKLINANYEVVDTLDVISDNRFGRFGGSFTLPTEGLLGNWRIEASFERKFVKLSDDDISSYPACNSSRNFKVEEYKEPSFIVDMKAKTPEVTAGNPVIIEGEALTYSGMPVSDATVIYEVKMISWWRIPGNASFNGTAVTDADGKFRIELDTSSLSGTAYDNRQYTVKAMVTDSAGESHDSPVVNFAIGSFSQLDVNMPKRINLSTDNRPVKVTVSRNGENVTSEIECIIIDERGAIVKKELFVTPDFDLGKLDLPSGRYKFTFTEITARENSESNGKDELSAADKIIKTAILYRDNDTVPPVSTPLWLPEYTCYSEPEGEVSIKIGSSYDNSYILALIVNSGKREGQYRWLRINDEMTEFNVEAPSDTTRTKVTFIGLHNGECVSQTVTIIPKVQTRKLQIETITFRDNIEPGSSEKWSFRFKYEGKEIPGIPVMAVMNNAALDALAPYNWAFGMDKMLGYYMPASFRYDHKSYIYSSAEARINYNYIRLKEPEWKLYGYSFDNIPGYGMVKAQVLMDCAVVNEVNSGVSYKSESKVMLRGAQVMTTEMAMDDADEAIEEEMPAAGNSNGSFADEGSSEPDTVQEPRNMECPLAFFMPDLVTDENGVAEVKFHVPDYNGKWNFYIMGYTPELKVAQETLSATAGRKVMVRLNAPRYLRIGDKAVIAATLYNNSADDQEIGGRMEIINPRTGALICEKKFDKELVSAKGSRVIDLDYPVTDECEVISLRAYAIGEGSQDGEQTPLIILPAAQPVIDASTFYVAPEITEMPVVIPEHKKGASLTLEYIDNPVWECVKALPGMIDGSDYNALSLVRNLFGVAVSKGIFKDYPSLLKGLEMMGQSGGDRESELVSSLEKNANLKTVVLGNTPWVRNGAAETLRMQSLLKYSDTKGVDNEIKRTVDLLKRLQTSEGGWPWCAGFKASEFVTGRVLLHLSMLRSMGYMPGGCSDMVKKAVKYCDNCIEKYYNDCLKHNVTPDENYLLDYWYLRYMYPEIKWNNTLEKTRLLALSGAGKWEKMSIYSKAIAAWVLYNAGDKDSAKTILRSLSQYATSTPEKGMWFDTLDSRFGAWNKLITTTQVLQTWVLVAPEDKEVGQLRQWLILSKLSEDWGANPYTAEIIATVIKSGNSGNLISRGVPELWIDGKKVALSSVSEQTGSFTYSLPAAKNKRRSIVIKRDAGTAAFGGVISQYMEKVSDVKAASVDELKIDKAVYVINPENGRPEVRKEINVGDRVLISVTVNSGRDMDYVAIIDERPACFEPVQQTSGYKLVGTTATYKEIRNSRTSFFLPYLPKGVTVLSYECMVSQSGEYALGLVSAQSQYEPAFIAHSSGNLINVAPAK